MTKITKFDDALPKFAEIVAQQWGPDALNHGVFLRDAIGKLTFVDTSNQSGRDERDALAKLAETVLGYYVDTDYSSVATPEELFDESLYNPANPWIVDIATAKLTRKVKVVDRRIVGADWLKRPVDSISWPPKLVFASMKGGVGRSTALCVVAADLAAKGRRVLAIDLDIEAPGLGNMLLQYGSLPEYGLLDYLVETGLGPTNDEFLVDMVSSSWLKAGHAPISVVPALGQASLRNPENVLSKISRAYLDQGYEVEQDKSFAGKLNALVNYFSESSNYDVILIDARAGLHETTASAITSLGAEVLLFGMDQTQTYAAYEIMLSHLSTLPGFEWKQRLHFVHAKAPTNIEIRKAFKERIGQILTNRLWSRNKRQTVLDTEGDYPFEVEWADDAETNKEVDALIAETLDFESAEILEIEESQNFYAFDPVEKPESLSELGYRFAYKAFLEKVTTLVDDFERLTRNET